jgi:branched-chain amino acid aminotransferase
VSEVNFAQQFQVEWMAMHMTRISGFTVQSSADSSAEAASRLTDNPAFGRVFTTHMASARFTGGAWVDCEIVPTAPVSIHPSTMALHYAQEIFEGLKVYRLPDGGAALFRPDANARRFRRSAQRLAMPELPESLFLDSVRKLGSIDEAWIPGTPGGALYLRPFMFASEAALGVKPAMEYRYFVLACPVGDYFHGKSAGVSLWVSESLSRAGPGGTGDAKCGGNYASSLAAQAEATANGCDQVVFLDAVERRWVEELGGMNVFFVFKNGLIQTPPLAGTILPGITRDSLITLARDQGYEVREAPYSIDQWQADARSGLLAEAFACGTAAVVTPIVEVTRASEKFQIGDRLPGTLTQRLKKALTDIQYGKAEDKFGWLDQIS